MGLRSWRTERSPWVGARLRAEARVAWLSSLSLADADRAVASLGGSEPLEPLVGDDPDSYTDAFVDRYEGLGATDVVRVVRCDPDELDRVVAVVFVVDEQLEVTVARGGLRVVVEGSQGAPSIAHLLLEELLDDEELESLASRGELWRRAAGRLDRAPIAIRPLQPFEIQHVTRAWAVLGSVVIGSLGGAMMVPLLLTLASRGLELRALPWIALASALVGAGLRSVWLHGRALPLAIASDGFFDPHIGARVRWEDATFLEPSWGVIRWRTTEGRVLSAPRAHFVEPDVTVKALRARCQGGAGAYRSRAGG